MSYCRYPGCYRDGMLEEYSGRVDVSISRVSAVYLLRHSGSHAMCQLSHSNWSHAIPLLHTYTYEYAEFGRTLPVEWNRPTHHVQGERGRLGSVGEKTRTAIGPRAPLSHLENGGDQNQKPTKTPESFFFCWVCSRDYRLAGRLGVMLGMLGIGMS